MFSRCASVTAASAAAALVVAKGYRQEIGVECISDDNIRHEEAVKAAARLKVLQVKEKSGAPGITVCVNKDGRRLWAEGFGLADVENMAAMTPQHVLRIASISKPVTMALVGRAIDEGRLDVNASVHAYLPAYPAFTVDGRQVEVTTEQLVTHRSGIRHYCKKEQVKKIVNIQLTKNKLANEILSIDEAKKHRDPAHSDLGETKRDPAHSDLGETKSENDTDDANVSDDTVCTGAALFEREMKEARLTTHFESVGEALRVFKDDELLFEPGTSYHYSTHGFTLVSAVLEAATQTKFAALLKHMFVTMGLHNTYLDDNETIISNRARYYARSAGGRLQNAAHVDNSWKVAGGGLLSTPADLCRLADVMLYSWQAAEDAAPAGYLRPRTVRWLWSPPPPPLPKKQQQLLPASPRRWPLPHSAYSRGWQVRPRLEPLGGGESGPFVASHTGSAAGCTSMLLVQPAGAGPGPAADGRPRGVTVAVIANLERAAGLTALAQELADLFAD